jgi:hypothetical protein
MHGMRLVFTLEDQVCFLLSPKILTNLFRLWLFHSQNEVIRKCTVMGKGGYCDE